MYNYQSTKLKYTILQQKISSSPQIKTAISVCFCQYPPFLSKSENYSGEHNFAKTVFDLKVSVGIAQGPCWVPN